MFLRIINTAQPLDNSNFDIIDSNLELLQDYYQSIISEIAQNISSKGKNLYLSDSVVISYTEREFIIKTRPINRDNKGRISRIYTYGQFANKEELDCQDVAKFNSQEVAEIVANFCHKIERDLCADTVETIKNGLDTAWENSRNTKFPIKSFERTESNKDMCNNIVSAGAGAGAVGGVASFLLLDKKPNHTEILILQALFIIAIKPYIPQIIRFFKDVTLKVHKSRKNL